MHASRDKRAYRHTGAQPIAQLFQEGWGEWMGLDESQSRLPSWCQVTRRRGRGRSLFFGGYAWLAPGLATSGQRTPAWGVRRARGFSDSDGWPRRAVVLCASCGMNPSVTPSYSCSFTCVQSGVSLAVPAASQWHLLVADVLSQRLCGQLANTAALHPSHPSPAPLALAALLALAVPSPKSLNFFSCNCMHRCCCGPWLACRSTAASPASSCWVLGAQK